MPNKHTFPIRKYLAMSFKHRVDKKKNQHGLRSHRAFKYWRSDFDQSQPVFLRLYSGVSRHVTGLDFVFPIGFLN